MDCLEIWSKDSQDTHLNMCWYIVYGCNASNGTFFLWGHAQRSTISFNNKKKRVKKVEFSDELWVLEKEIFYCRIFFVVVPPGSFYHILSWLKQYFQIMQHLVVNYDKMLIDLVWLRQTKKSLAFSHGAWTLLHSVHTSEPWAKYFPILLSHSVNEYIIMHEKLSLWSLYLYVCDCDCTDHVCSY